MRADFANIGRVGRWLALALVLFAALASCGDAEESSKRETPKTLASDKPNVLFVLTDDQNTASMSAMPETNRLIKDAGVTFGSTFATTPWCCPSRASMLTGQYPHNSGVESNAYPTGGERRFRENGLQSDTVATRLDGQGYATALFGKYLNEYDHRYVPPGWDRWNALMGSAERKRMNANGTEIEVNEETFDAAVADRALGFVGTRAAQPEPFFAWVSFNAPHYPARHESRYDGRFSDAPLPKPPNFDEQDTSDKPAYVRERPEITDSDVSRMTAYNRDRLRSLQTVDRFVLDAVRALRDAGELDNTYIVFYTDNGETFGNHGVLGGKLKPYDEDQRFPMLVRGPGIPWGQTKDDIVLNNDVAPTFAEMGGADAPAKADGRSFLPLAKGESLSWRDAGLIEAPGIDFIPAYRSVRTGRWQYTEYETGERELYDLDADPFQLSNLLHEPTPEAAAKAQELAVRLEALKDCAGETCGVAEMP